MANMSYCRFENTLRDLRDCFDNMDNNDLSESEFYARKQMIELCTVITSECEDLLDEEWSDDDEAREWLKDNDFQTWNEAPYGND